MLTTLATVKSRLAILDTDSQYDALLTATIKAISARFNHETNRTLARAEDATHEFSTADTEILVPCYPIETVTKSRPPRFRHRHLPPLCPLDTMTLRFSRPRAGRAAAWQAVLVLHSGENSLFKRGRRR